MKGERGGTVAPLPLKTSYPFKGNVQYFVHSLEGKPYTWKGLMFAMALWKQHRPHVSVDFSWQQPAGDGWEGLIIWTDNTPQNQAMEAAA